MQDLSGSWCIKGTGESILIMDSSVPLMHHDPHGSWIAYPDQPKGTHPTTGKFSTHSPSTLMTVIPNASASPQWYKNTVQYL